MFLYNIILDIMINSIFNVRRKEKICKYIYKKKNNNNDNLSQIFRRVVLIIIKKILPALGTFLS